MVFTGLRRIAFAALGALTLVGAQLALAAPAKAVPGLQNVTTASVVNSNIFKSQTAMCPAGKRVVGGGARLSILTNEVAITQFAPLPTGDGIEARAYEDWDGFVGNWGLVAHAICADPLPGYEIQTATSPSASPPSASVVASCTPGRRLLGTGGSVFPGRGVVVLTGAIPQGGLSPTGARAFGEKTEVGYLGDWTVSVWAICADPVPGHTTVTATTVFDSTSPKTQTVTCPAGTQVHGLGVQIGGGQGEVFLNAAVSTPNPVSTQVPTRAVEDQTGFLPSWAMRTHAICAN
ncbi:hypothetical protein [Rhizohabitans arisaemae]|uniref:hypothetical protein n=1 Tax=Rhizohabitans arisaemae TaxID=2720610 RepID=UPI0024B09995|nr:hypothetical protein [Rhizohabitans arisaemae]